MINNAVLVSVAQKRDSVAHTRVSVLFQTLLPFRLLHNIEQSSLRSTVCPCWLSILSIAVCTCWSQTPWLSSPTLFPTGNCKFVHLLPIFLFLFNYVYICKHVCVYSLSNLLWNKWVYVYKWTNKSILKILCKWLSNDSIVALHCLQSRL